MPVWEAAYEWGQAPRPCGCYLLKPESRMGSEQLSEVVMYAIEFEADITGKYLELKEWQSLLNKHARVIILVDEVPQAHTASDDLTEFRTLQATREKKPEIAKDMAVESMEDDINNDVF